MRGVLRGSGRSAHYVPLIPDRPPGRRATRVRLRTALDVLDAEAVAIFNSFARAASDLLRAPFRQSSLIVASARRISCPGCVRAETSPPGFSWVKARWSARTIAGSG
jgi:hypothetical protein